MTASGYTIYALIGTILEQAVAVIIVLGVLPLLNIYIPLWGMICILAALLLFSVYTYIMGRRALSKKPMFTSEAIIGLEGITTTRLSPNGYIKVKGELWKASSESIIDVGETIIVTEIEGLKLIVIPKDNKSTNLY